MGRSKCLTRSPMRHGESERKVIGLRGRLRAACAITDSTLRSKTSPADACSRLCCGRALCSIGTRERAPRPRLLNLRQRCLFANTHVRVRPDPTKAAAVAVEPGPPAAGLRRKGLGQRPRGTGPGGFNDIWYKALRRLWCWFSKGRRPTEPRPRAAS